MPRTPKLSELAAWQLATRYAYAMGAEMDRARSATWIGELNPDHTAPIVVIHWFGWDRPDGGVVRVLHHNRKDLPDITVEWAHEMRAKIERGSYRHPWTHAVKELLDTPVVRTRRKQDGKR